MDFIVQLPPSHGKTTIWVVIDRLSKFGHFIALGNHYTAATLTHEFLANIYHLHGIPKSIVSDRDPLFLSKFWVELFKQLGTTLAHSSAYHPQSDGQSEVLNRCLETYLRCFASDEPKSWSRYLHLAEFWYNSSHHTAIGMRHSRWYMVVLHQILLIMLQGPPTWLPLMNSCLIVTTSSPQ